MKLKDIIIEDLKDWIVSAIRFLYGWFTTDGEILGYILAVFHIMISFSVIFMILICHTIYPNFWLQLIVFLSLFAIWIHHVVLNVCISVVAEQNLTQSISPFYEMMKSALNSYNISIDEFVKYFMITETVGVVCFAMEITSRCFYYVFKFIKN